MITLIQIGGESLDTLAGAVRRMGLDLCRAGRPDQAARSGPILLAGAGPLDPACASLKRSGWWRELPQLAADGRPVLGINLGLHLLAEGSEESPRASGLGLIPGIVRRFGPGVKAPHWGWSPVRPQRSHPPLPEVRAGWLFFAHAHALDATSESLAIAVHGRPFSVVEGRGRTLGVQAHLEKSGRSGLALLEQLLAAMGECPQPGSSLHCN